MTREEVLNKFNTLSAAPLSDTTVEPGSVLIGDKIISDTVESNNPDQPALTDHVLVFKTLSDGTKRYVIYTVQQLIDSLAQEATDAASAAQSAQQAAESAASQAATSANSANDALEETQQVKDDAMIAIGEDNESGARGNAIEAIEEAKTDALAQLDGKIKGGYRVVIGDGTTTDFTINHNLGGEWHLAWAWSEDPAELPYHKIQELDSNSLKVSFYEPPAADSVEIRVISAERVEIADIPDNIEIGPENLSSDCFMTAEEITAIIGG